MAMHSAGHIKIAITTNSLTEVDAGFANAGQVVVYNVSSEDAEFLDCVQFRGGSRLGLAPGEAKKGPGGGKGCAMDDLSNGVPTDRMLERVEAIAGCGVLFTLGLSDLHAVHVKRRGVFPVKMEESRSVDDVVASLQTMLKNNPPLWLRRALRDSGGKSLGMVEQSE
jgi:nitrogen fixation protein NifX